MLHSVEATIEANGKVRLTKPVHLKHACRAIVTIFMKPEVPEISLLSEQSLAADWDTPEEDNAWSHLQ
ncbi:MAG: hypothetical protein WC340_06780 [Kiritimatiellia bacterium]